MNRTSYHHQSINRSDGAWRRDGRVHRRLAVGAEVLDSGGVHFRVWAPRRHSMEVVLRSGPGEGRAFELSREEDGYFSGLALEAGVGTRYSFRLGGAGGSLLPDPASRY